MVLVGAGSLCDSLRRCFVATAQNTWGHYVTPALPVACRCRLTLPDAASVPAPSLLQGTELMSMGIIGPSIGVLTDRQLCWMYETPDITVDAMRELVTKAAAELPPPPAKKAKSRKGK